MMNNRYMIQSQGRDGRWGTEATAALTLKEANDLAIRLNAFDHVVDTRLVTL